LPLPLIAGGVPKVGVSDVEARHCSQVFDETAIAWSHPKHCGCRSRSGERSANPTVSGDNPSG